MVHLLSNRASLNVSEMAVRAQNHENHVLNLIFFLSLNTQKWSMCSIKNDVAHFKSSFHIFRPPPEMCLIWNRYLCLKCKISIMLPANMDAKFVIFLVSLGSKICLTLVPCETFATPPIPLYGPLVVWSNSGIIRLLGYRYSYEVLNNKFTLL